MTARGDKLTLRYVLENDQLASEFQVFLASEFAAENLFFYRMVSKFQKPQEKIDEQMRLTWAKKIFEDYVKLDAPNEVNITIAIRQAIAQSLEQNLAPVTLFDMAKEDVYHVMEEDSFVRFMRLRKDNRKRSGIINPSTSCFVDQTLIAS